MTVPRRKDPNFPKKTKRINEYYDALPNLPTCSPNVMLHVGGDNVLTDKHLETGIGLKHTLRTSHVLRVRFF